MIDTTKDKEIILLGDFNIDLNKPNQAWEDIILLYNFKQIINRSTRVTENASSLIDHVYISCAGDKIEFSVPLIAVTDYYPIRCTWYKKGYKTPKREPSSVKFRNFKKFNKDLFLQDLRNSPLDHVFQLPDPDGAIAYWTKTVYDVFDKHVPVKEVRVKHQVISSWITIEVLEMMRGRDTAHKNKDYTKYRRLINQVQYLIRRVKKEHFKQLIYAMISVISFTQKLII